jgi:DNA-binding MarR family transcriptional regulator
MNGARRSGELNWLEETLPTLDRQGADRLADAMFVDDAARTLRAGLNLTVNQARLLLAVENSFDPRSASELARLLGITLPSLLVSLAALERLNMVSRAASNRYRRSPVCLTGGGSAATRALRSWADERSDRLGTEPTDSTA